MYKGKKVLAIIPARGGSKGLPRKNILPLLERPLIAWTIAVAQASHYIDRVVVSTDDEEIASVARRHGADVPFMRPDAIAQDTSLTADALIHALDTFKHAGETYDYIMLVQTTSPLRKKGDIDRGVQLLLDRPDVQSLMSAGEIHEAHPIFAKKMQGGYMVPYADFPIIHQRQQADPAYFPYGLLFIARVDDFFEQRTFYMDTTIPMFIERWQNYEIDDAVDFLIVETLMKRYRLELDG